MSKKKAFRPKRWRWMYGRTGSGHQIFTLIWSKYLKFDCYLVYFPLYSHIPNHYDPTEEDRKHYRLNIILWKAKKGGEFKCENTIFSLFNRIHFFRPDQQLHSVSRVMEGRRYMLSFGKTVRRKK